MTELAGGKALSDNSQPKTVLNAPNSITQSGVNSLSSTSTENSISPQSATAKPGDSARKAAVQPPAKSLSPKQQNSSLKQSGTTAQPVALSGNPVPKQSTMQNSIVRDTVSGKNISPITQSEQPKPIGQNKANVKAPVDIKTVNAPSVSTPSTSKNNMLANGQTPKQVLSPIADSQVKKEPAVANSNVVDQSNNNQPVKAKQAETNATSDNSSYSYSIRLDAFNDYHDIRYYKDKYGFPFDVICVEVNGIKSYYAGKYKTIEEATADIAKYGITGFIVPIGDTTKSGLKK